jgi:kinesin family protein 22
MQGSDEQPGLIPRVARKVVALAAQRTSATKGPSSGGKCSVTVSYLEIYNEKVFDLLRPKTKDLPIREDTNKNILIPDLAQVPQPHFLLVCKPLVADNATRISLVARSHI